MLDYMEQGEKNCRTCKHCGWDPDGNYCAHDAAMKVSPTYGLSLRAAIQHHCTNSFKNWTNDGKQPAATLKSPSLPEPELRAP